MMFKNFEIRPVKLLDGTINPKRFELVKWYDHEPYVCGSNITSSCFVVAWLTWNPKEPDWKLESVGMRLMENWVDGLDRWVLAWCEMQRLCMEDNDE